MGEAASADEDAATAFPATFKKLIEEEYDPEQVFNMDETALLWKKMPKIRKKTTPRHKVSKERVKLLLCATAVGHTIQTACIYKFANCRALKRKNKNLWPVY